MRFVRYGLLGSFCAAFLFSGVVVLLSSLLLLRSD